MSNGWIFGAVIYDESTGEDFVYSEKSGRNPFPVEIPYGHIVSVSISVENTGNTKQYMVATAELVDPDGIIQSSKSAHSNLSPGVVMTSGRTPDVMPDKFGIWSIHAVLETEDTVIDEKTWEAVSITENGGNGEPPSPPIEFSFPWWLVVVGAAVAVFARTRKILKKE